MANEAQIQASLFERALLSRKVTNFPGDNVEEAAQKACEAELCTVQEFKAATVGGLIVPRGRRYSRIRTGFRTLTPAEREVWEARHTFGNRKVHIPEGMKRNLSSAENRELQRRQEAVHKRERLQARTRLVDLIADPTQTLTKKDRRRLKRQKRKGNQVYYYPADPSRV